MKSVCRFALVLALSGAAISPALAQSSDEEVWTGPYVGLQAGARYASGASNETLVFDKDLDGQFDDMIATTAAPTVDLFAPGYCDGRAASDRVSGGCFKDKDKFDIAAHAGYDKQFGNIVVGLVAEYRYPSLTDSVSGFTSTPDAYVFRRKLQHEVGLRARAGIAARNALFYVTGGGAWGKFKSDFITSNDDNKFVGSGKSGAWGWKAGAGVEQKLTPYMSLGVQYLYTKLSPKDFTVRASGGTAGNPFITTNTAGTDIRRSGTDFSSSTFAATINWRF